MKVYRNVVMLALIAALPLAGCVAIQRSEARDTEQLLAAAGFQAKPADGSVNLLRDCLGLAQYAILGL